MASAISAPISLLRSASLRCDLFNCTPRHLFLLAVAPPSRVRPPPRATRRYPSYTQEAVVVVPDPRVWIGDFGAEGGDDDGEDESDEEEDDRSLDLLVRFLQNMFRKISRQTRKSVRSVLPRSIPTKLVRFSVNGILILTFLWILKAFLEVVCTLGSIVFVSILLVRGVWSGINYMKDRQYHYINRVDNDDDAWSGVQPAT